MELRLVETQDWKPGCLFGPPARDVDHLDHTGMMYFVLQFKDGAEWRDVPVEVYVPERSPYSNRGVVNDCGIVS